MSNKLITLLLLLIAPSILADKQQAKIDALLDGLHQDAHDANFKTYFALYTSDAIFLGTAKTERWTI